jgi:hypothetical protein
MPLSSGIVVRAQAAGADIAAVPVSRSSESMLIRGDFISGSDS